MPPNDETLALVDDALASLKDKPMNDEVLFRKIMLNHVKSSKERADKQEREMVEMKSGFEVLRNDMTVLKDSLLGLENQKVKDLSDKVSVLEKQMLRVYAIAGAASLVGGWIVPSILKHFFP